METPAKKHKSDDSTRGYLFKRWRGKHLPASSPIVATWYYAYEVDRKRYTVCLHTTDRAIAEKSVQEFVGKVDWSGREAYLRSLVELGERAKRELWGLKHDAKVVALKDMWQEYVKSRRRPDSGESTMQFYKTHVRAFVDWAPMAVRNMRQVTSALAEQYVRELEQRVVGSVAVQHIGTLRRVWRVVEPEGPQPWNDLRPVGGHAPKPYRRLMHGECVELVKAAEAWQGSGANNEWMGMIIVAYYTALRMSDIVGIKQENVDWHNHWLYLPAPRKTSRRKPQPLYIPMMPELEEELRRRSKGMKSGDYFFPEAARQHAGNDRSKLSKIFAKIFERAGVLDNAQGAASFHSLRATFVSAMDEAGAPPRITDMVTNHAPRSMHDRYSHPDVGAVRQWMTKALRRIRTRD